MLNTSLFFRLRSSWLSNIQGDIMAGTVVALALIPETIAFSIIAGIDPAVGFYTAFSIAIVIAFLGGRPGMISSMAGAMAVIVVTLVKTHGLAYVFAASMLAGVIQMIAGYFNFSQWLRFISRSVSIGFLNALAMLIFLAQIPSFQDASWIMYAMVALGLSIIYLFPTITKAIPSTLVCIIVLTMISIGGNLPLKTIGDMGALPTQMPTFLLPNVPFCWETFRIIFPYALTLAMVGLLESLMTTTIIDDLTGTTGNKNQECRGQGIANIISSLLGGMAGCALIGQSVINIKSGGRTRLSMFFAGVLMILLIITLGDFVKKIPLAALVAVMIMVSISTFHWPSLFKAKKTPLTSNIVVFATVAVVISTHDLAKGVLTGILLSGIFFAYKVEKLFTIHLEHVPKEKKAVYHIVGQIFFASTEKFIQSFHFQKTIKTVVIHVEKAHFWDISSVEALQKVIKKFEENQTWVHIVGLSEKNSQIIDRLKKKEMLQKYTTPEKNTCPL